MRPVVEHMKLQIRFNPGTRSVEIKVRARAAMPCLLVLLTLPRCRQTSEHTVDGGALQKAADFVQAFMLGFEVQDAIALLRMEDLYVGECACAVPALARCGQLVLTTACMRACVCRDV